jgi:hypothetical protein
LSTRDLERVKWWQRWVEAESLPQTVVYENVHRESLEALLRSAQIGMSGPFPTFPPEIETEEQKTQFIDQFLAGSQEHSIAVQPGDYIGLVGPNASGDPVDPFTPRLLILHVYYHDHSEASPHPMNPRELFHLLFGNDSVEATSHPLLLRIHHTGEQNQPNVHPESRRMLLRPPLRTWRRVIWEAELEDRIDTATPKAWQPKGQLGTDRFYNNYDDGTRHFNRALYKGLDKCNLFVSDIALRAGFRVPVHPVDADKWHYIDANSCANASQEATGTDERVPLRGRGSDANTPWGWKLENLLHTDIPQPATLRSMLNDSLQKEGRCFILAGARAQKFAPMKLPGEVKGIASCLNTTNGGSLRNRGIGHIVLVKEVLNEPSFGQPNAAQRLESIKLATWEASGQGAESRETTFRLGGADGAASSANGFIRLQLIELHPGGDPDTLQGLANLNVSASNRNLLGTPDERAMQVRLTHNPDGTPRTDHRCCVDDEDPQAPNRDGREIPCE